MTDDSTPKQAFRWLSNMYCPLDRTDKAYLDKLGDYKIGVPQQAYDIDGTLRPTSLSLDELRDFNIVGIYTTEAAIRKPNPDKITQDHARAALGADFAPLEGHLAKYLDGDCHFIGRQ